MASQANDESLDSAGNPSTDATANPLQPDQLESNDQLSEQPDSLSRQKNNRSRSLSSRRKKRAARKSDLGEDSSASASHATIAPGFQLGFQSGAQSGSSSAVNPVSTAATGTERASRYEPIDELGRGGWGVVESAFDHQLDRVVAVKRIGGVAKVSDEMRQRFLHEAKITSQLQHPGIVPVHELSGEVGVDGEMFYVMKLLEGDTLRHEIRSIHEQLKENHVKPSSVDFHDAILPLLNRFVDVCNAVGYAHEQNVIHRDLKPANIMTGKFGETIVVDWGLAKYIASNNKADEAGDADWSPVRSEMRSVDDISEDVDRSESLCDAGQNASRSQPRRSTVQTSQGAINGTPAYMSPQQAVGDANDPSADLYSLGVILYEILVGTHPFTGLDCEAVLDRVRKSEWNSPQEQMACVPRPLSAICIKAMQADPADRYALAQEISDEVQRYITGDKVHADTESMADRFARWCRRHRTLATTMAAVTLVGFVAAVCIALVIRSAHAVERVARRDAQTAHADAIERLTQTREAADSWLIDLSGALQFYPGLEPIREKLIDDAIAEYEALLASTQTAYHSEIVANNDDPLWLEHQRLDQQRILERIRCSCRLGDLYRLSGEMQLAKSHYALTARDSKQLMETHANSVVLSPDFQHRIRCEQVNALVGKLLLSDGLPVGESERQQGLVYQAQMAEWLDQHPIEKARVLKDADRLWCKTASCLSRLAFASSQYELAAFWSQRLFEHRGSDSDASWVQTVAMRYAGQLDTSGSAADCTRVWQGLVDHLVSLCDLRPRRVDYRQSLANARLKLADSLRKSEGAGDRAAIYEQSVNDLNHSIMLTNADEFCIANLARAELGLGSSLGENADTRNQAEQHLRKAIALFGQMLKTEMNASTLREFAKAHQVLIDLDGELMPAQVLPLIDTAKLAFTMLHDHELATSADRLNLATLILRQATMAADDSDAIDRIDEMQKCLDCIPESELDSGERTRFNWLRRQAAQSVQNAKPN